MFDFANSSFTTSIITVIFAVYFVKVIAEGRTDADFYWGMGNFLSQGVVLLTAPLLGALADFSGAKKRLLFAAYATCVVFTALLTFTGPGGIAMALICFIIANIGYSAGENLVSSFLPEIASPDEMARISGFAWAWGYCGGLVSLGLCYPFIRDGISLETYGTVRWTNLVVAAFFMVAAIPTFLWVKERNVGQPLPEGETYLSISAKQVMGTLKHLSHFGQLFYFLIIFAIFNCGLNAVVAFSAIYGSETLKLAPTELIKFFMIVQVTSAVGAFLFGYLQDWFGAKVAINAALLIWIGVSVGSYFATTVGAFYLVGNMAGLAMGATQSGSRALVGLFSPPAHSAEFFGFWGLFWKLSSAIGPLVFGFVSTQTGSQRTAILSIGVFFLIGFIGMFFVDEKKGREAAASYASPA